jgi:hypothetical protein
VTDRDDQPQEPANEVGYGKPPLHSRFKPGRSGNPRGRPSGKKGIEEFATAVLSRKIWVTADGRRKRMPFELAMMLKFGEKALKGDLKAARMLLDLKGALAVAVGTAASNEVLSREDLAILATAGVLGIVKDEPDVGP